MHGVQNNESRLNSPRFDITRNNPSEWIDWKNVSCGFWQHGHSPGRFVSYVLKNQQEKFVKNNNQTCTLKHIWTVKLRLFCTNNNTDSFVCVFWLEENRFHLAVHSILLFFMKTQWKPPNIHGILNIEMIFYFWSTKNCTKCLLTIVVTDSKANYLNQPKFAPFFAEIFWCYLQMQSDTNVIVLCR